jgi:hypothetical protein
VSTSAAPDLHAGVYDVRTGGLRAIALVTALGLTFGAYFVLRYAGLWSEQDTAAFMNIVVAMGDAGRLFYPSAYPHGFGYGVWMNTLAAATGVDVATLTQVYAPMIGTVFLAVFSFAAYRRLLASEELGMLATAVIFLVPEVVFTVSRGNHEKLTVALTLLVFLAFVRSFTALHYGDWREFAGWLVVLHVANGTMLTMNLFFGSTFVFASSVILVVALLLSPWVAAVTIAFRRRLAAMAAVGWLMVILTMWHVYPPAGANVALLNTTVERLVEFFVGTFGRGAQEADAGLSFDVSNPYEVTQTDWASPLVYLVVSSFRGVFFLVSFATWIALLVRTVRGRDSVRMDRLTLVALYGAFGILLAAAIPVDFMNLSAGSNLQVRVYTYFSLIAPPLFVVGLTQIAIWAQGARLGIVVRGAGAAVMSGFLILSLLKSSLDPMVSNRWLFYRPSEIAAVQFWDTRHRRAMLWLEQEGRVRYGFAMHYPGGTLYWGGSHYGNVFVMGASSPLATHALSSPLIVENVAAWSSPGPLHWIGNRTYDNGFAQVYQRLPVTPFQR